MEPADGEQTARPGAFSDAEVVRSRSIRRQLLVVGVVGGAIAGVAGAPVFVRRLSDWHVEHTASTPWWVQVVVYAVGLQLFWLALNLVVGALTVITVGRRTGLVRGGLGSALRPVTAQSAMGLGLVIPQLLVIWACARTFEAGWVVAGPVVAVGTLASARRTLRTVRLGRPVEPLRDERCLRLFDEVFPDGLRRPSLWLARTSRSSSAINAMVCPDGDRLAVVVFDTALALPDDQLRSLLAHEVGHVALGHLPKRSRMLAILAGVAALLAMWALPAFNLLGPQRAALGEGRPVVVELGAPPAYGRHVDVPLRDGRTLAILIDHPVRGLPLLAVDFLWTSLVIRAVITVLWAAPRVRAQEAEADRFALDRTGDLHAFTTMIHAITVANGSRIDRQGMGCGHAPAQERIHQAEAWAHHRSPGGA